MLNWFDRTLIRWITRLILLHMFLCVMAFFMVIYSLIAIWDFTSSLSKPSTLMREAEVLDLPLVRVLDLIDLF